MMPGRGRAGGEHGASSFIVLTLIATRPCQRGTWGGTEADFFAGNVERDGDGLCRRDAVSRSGLAASPLSCGNAGKRLSFRTRRNTPFPPGAGKKTKEDGRRRRHPDGRKRTGERKKKGRGKKEGKGGTRGRTRGGERLTRGRTRGGERLTRGPQSKLSRQEAEMPDLSETAKKRPGYPRGDAPCGSKVFAQGPDAGTAPARPSAGKDDESLSSGAGRKSVRRLRRRCGQGFLRRSPGKGFVRFSEVLFSPQARAGGRPRTPDLLLVSERFSRTFLETDPGPDGGTRTCRRAP